MKIVASPYKAYLERQSPASAGFHKFSIRKIYPDKPNKLNKLNEPNNPQKTQQTTNRDKP
jgi:hypothetical protein